ncbi:LysR family transcriptional regulator ArgP [Shewanella sp. Scap07]|uniref:LysR family transcriptional regulator ArgP n=1 Tax=Shewanella sp. Scap07 TaxID=2589987 RepID=UPI0015C1278B|nr:LysR family transcriptional regulator ArgP [Shewanella sp. Scap07]QLE85429.1 LysR family transcriptional regulator ArgP [Shewanella sp. Scap07]
MLDYGQLHALYVVANQGSFERAAKILCVTQSAVSQRIKQLEERVGQALLIRSSPVTVTELGKRLLRHFNHVQLLEDELNHEIGYQDSHLPVKVSIAVNADTLATWFLPALAGVFSRHGWILELIIDDESYTHHLLKNGEAVGCVTTTAKALAGCSSDHLGDMRYLCLATPEFYQQYFANGVNQDTLSKAPAVVFNTKDLLHQKFLAEHFQMQAGQWAEHQIPSSESFLEAIKLGMGYGLVSHLQAQTWLDSGSLVEVTPDIHIDVALYWQHWNIKAQHTSIIYRALASVAKDQLK